MSCLREFYESIDHDLRRKILRCGFLFIGIIAVARGDMAFIWAAWLGATVAGFLGITRRFLYGAFVALFIGICVLVYLWLDLWLAQTNFGALPHARDFPNVIAYAGIVMETLFALYALDGRYKYQHDAWQMKHPFSRAYVPMEMERRRKEAEQEVQDRQPPEAR